MANKMYLLVEGDKQSCDPLSKLMTQLVDQLNCCPPRVPQCPPMCPPMCPPLCPPPCPPPCPPRCVTPCPPQTTQCLTNVSNDPSCGPNAKALVCQPSCTTSPCDPSNIRVECHTTPTNATTITTMPSGMGRGGQIAAEASIDKCGRAQAKVLVCEAGAERVRSSAMTPGFGGCSGSSEGYSFGGCGRRNGLDPSPSEMRGQRKFEYLPHSSRSGGRSCAKPFPITDRIGSSSSVGSRCSLYKSIKRHTPGAAMMRDDCLKNVPEARLTKFSACINRRDGLQDKCDGLSKRAIKKCCKSKSPC